MPPPPPPGFGPSDPNRDYQLLAGDEAEAEAAQQPRKHAAAGRLFALASGEVLPLCAGTLLLLVSAVAQIAVPRLAGALSGSAALNPAAG